MPQKSGAKRDHSESGVTDCIQGVSAWRTSKRAGERFPIFFSKTFKKKIYIYTCFKAGYVFLDTLSLKMLSIFFYNIEILLILNFKIHSPAGNVFRPSELRPLPSRFQTVQVSEYAVCPILTSHKNVAPVKDSVTIITSTQFFIYSF